MFRAENLRPDAQLAAFLAAHPAQRHYPTYEELHQVLFHTRINIYSNFRTNLPPIHYGGGVGPATVEFLKGRLDRPVRFMVEVGSFVGSSAAIFAKHLLHGSADSSALLLCIDTWDGDANMWLLDSFVKRMALHHGAPSLYERFLDRMVSEGLQQSVIPLRTSSAVGARILAALKYNIDVIFLDSAHEAGETYVELNLYWDLLSFGGVLCGDDYHNFPAVKHDLDLFMHHQHIPVDQLNFSRDNRTWALVKA